MIRKFMVLFMVSFCVKATVLTLTEPAGRDSWELGRIAGYIAQGKGYISPFGNEREDNYCCLLYTSPSPRDRTRSRMPSSA